MPVFDGAAALGTEFDLLLDVDLTGRADGYFVYYDLASDKLMFQAAPGGLAEVVDDTTPALGGTLDANGNSIDMGTNTITDTKVGQWDTAYGWGDHASAGYAVSGGAEHDGFSDYVADEHIDWTVDDAQLIHIDNIQTFGSTQAGKVPQSGGGTTNYLRADGTWAAPGGGDTALDSTPDTDHTVSGLTATFTNGTAGAITIGQLVYIASDGDVELADADASTTMPGLALVADASISASGSGSFLLHGFIRDDTWSWTAGGALYAGTTAGGMTQTAPSGSGDQIQRVGIAVSSTVVYFAPSLDVGEYEA